MTKSRRDSNHRVVIDALRNRCGGYWRDENGAHHANLRGLRVDAYDMYKVGSGFPDWLVNVSWLSVYIEIKNLEGRGERYTDGEKLFMQNFSGIRRTFFEQNEVYDFLSIIADYVLWIEEQAESLPPEYRATFFPKLSGLPVTENQ